MNVWLKYGFITGVVVILQFLFLNIVIVVPLHIQMVVSLVSYVVLGYLAARSQRINNGGVLTYGESVKVIFLALTIGSIISVLFTMVYLEYIDPSAKQTMIDLTLDFTRYSLEMFNAPADMVEEQMMQMEEGMELMSYGAKEILMGLPQSIIYGLIIALNQSLFTKKPPKS